MDLVIPDFLPQLRHGVGEQPADGGCLMQCASFIAYGAWDDRPDCVHDYLNHLGIRVNDSVPDPARSGLATVIPDLLNSELAYVEWSHGTTIHERRGFYVDRVEFARSLFEEAGVKSCATCAMSLATSDDPQGAAINYTGCLIDNAAHVLWSDPCWEDVFREAGKVVPEEAQQRKLVNIYKQIVADFNEAVGNSPQEVTETQWRDLKSAMTPAA